MLNLKKLSLVIMSALFVPLGLVGSSLGSEKPEKEAPQTSQQQTHREGLGLEGGPIVDRPADLADTVGNEVEKGFNKVSEALFGKDEKK
ncbi:MAG: hypothetical protein K2Y18_05625 [Alphaproteobacteria bacterium]|jgi:hypothetical protein|nr:hypothetical protein [Alphaproteobacteria bacterium]